MSALPLLTRIWGIARRTRRCAFGRNWLTPTQPSGPLNFDSAVLPSAVYPIGCFVITWDASRGGELRVTHQARPARVLWATLPGQAFVAAAQGAERVTESRSHFSIADTLHAVLPDWSWRS
jgi:hypothetical protein